MSHLDLQQNKGRAKDDIVGTISRYIKLTKKGDEFVACCPFHDEDTPSFTVTPATGYYYCFGCGEGGDAIDFVSKHEGIGFAEAVNHIVGNHAGETSPVKRQSIKQPKAMDVWEQIVPVPAEAPSPNFTFNRMTATRTWMYRDAKGGRIGYVCRFDKPEGGKEVVPLTYWVNRETGEMKWRYASFSKPRPMYGLDKLAVKPDAQVLIVEGEKAADAAQKLFGDKLVVVSWPGGGKAVKFVDWSPLKGRRVGLWPDADQKVYPDRHEKAGKLMPFIEQPGTVAMMDIGAALQEVAASLKFIMPPEGVQDGWDLADELPDGFNLMAHAKSAAKTYDEFLSEYFPAPNAEPAPELVGTPEPEQESVNQTPVEPTQDPANDNAASESGDDDYDLDDCGFTVVGYDREGTFIYHHGRGQIRHYRAREFTDNTLAELAPPNWWEKHFAGTNGGIDKKAAVFWISKQAQKQGIYDQECVRGRGAWIDQGRIVVHLGDRLLVDGEVTALNKISSRFVYERAKALGDISESAISDAEGKKIIDTARLFRWERTVSADLLCGWLFLAPICGALKWRPHIWVTGGAGSGKTTVMDKFVRMLMPKGSPLFANGDSTEAGLRQALGSEARPLLIDETEADSQKAKAKMEQVIGLLRQSSSETAAKTFRGTVSGNHQSFALRAMACLSSIGVSLEQAQDIERVEVLHLRPKTDQVNDTPWDVLSGHLLGLAADMSIGDRMMRRAIDMADTINTAIEVFSRVAAVTLESQRNGDQIGALLAGAWCLQHSEAPTFEDAERVISDIDWSERKMTHVEEEVSLIATLVATPVNVGGGMRMTIGDLIEYAAGLGDDQVMSWKNAAHQLQMYGMKVFPAEGVVKIHTANRELLAAMDGTKFSTGFHDRLRRIEGANTMSGKTFRIGNASRNGVAIPLSTLIEVDDNKPPI